MAFPSAYSPMIIGSHRILLASGILKRGHAKPICLLADQICSPLGGSKMQIPKRDFLSSLIW